MSAADGRSCGQSANVSRRSSSSRYTLASISVATTKLRAASVALVVDSGDNMAMDGPSVD